MATHLRTFVQHKLVLRSFCFVLFLSCFFFIKNTKLGGLDLGRIGGSEYEQNILYETPNYERTNKNNLKLRFCKAFDKK